MKRAAQKSYMQMSILYKDDYVKLNLFVHLVS